MTNPNIKKDVDFVIRVLDNPNNKKIHLPALVRLIKNFEGKWNDLLGSGVVDFYINLLNNKYKDALQYSKRNDRPNR